MLLVTEDTNNGQYKWWKQQPSSSVVFFSLLIEAQNKLGCVKKAYLQLDAAATQAGASSAQQGRLGGGV